MPTSGTICADAGAPVPHLHNDKSEKLERGPDGIERAVGTGHQMRAHDTLDARVRVLRQVHGLLAALLQHKVCRTGWSPIHMQDAVQSQSLEACMHRLLRVPF